MLDIMELAEKAVKTADKKKAYEECARDKLADRTTTCRKVRCQSLTDRMQKQMRKQSCRDDGIAFSRSLFVGNRGGIVNEKRLQNCTPLSCLSCSA